MLTAVQFIGYRTQGRRTARAYLWQCDCGTQKEMTAANVTRTQEPIKSCGCLKESKTRYKGVQAFQYQVFKTSGYDESDITLEQFLELSQKNCHYCNRSVSLSGNLRYSRCGKYQWRYHGLDRKNNCLVHCLSNVVPCCWSCNNMKGKMSYQEFTAHIASIARNLELK